MIDNDILLAQLEEIANLLRDVRSELQEANLHLRDIESKTT